MQKLTYIIFFMFIYNLSLQAQNWTQLGLDIDGEAVDDYSGYSVSMDGNRMAIGTPYNDGNGTLAGHVRIYDWNGTAWVQLGADIDGAASTFSGYSVSLDGNRVAIGAPTSNGHVRIYDWNGTAWVQLGANINGSYNSGSSVSLDGNMVAIGAPDNDANTPGQVRVYNWNGTTWVQLGANIIGEATGDNFGRSVSLDGNRVAIGARNNDGTASDAGHVRVYDWNGTAWVKLGLDIDGEAAADNSGYSVSLDANRVAIGARNNDGTASDAGHVRVYDWNGTAWVKLGLDIDGEAAGDNSGWSVSLAGNRVAIGANNNDGTASDAGHVRVYDWNGTAWVKLGLDIDGEAAGDLSGNSVSLDGNRVAIGATRNDGTGSNAGHVRVYDYPSPIEINITGNGNNITDGQTAIATSDDTDFGSTVECSGTMITKTYTIQNTGTADLTVTAISSSLPNFVISAITLPAVIAGGGSTTFDVTFSTTTVGTFTASINITNNDVDENPYSFNVEATTTSASSWTQLGLDIDGEAAGDQFGGPVSLDGNRMAIGAIFNDGNGLSAGHVRVYDWNGTAWVQLGLDIDGEAAGDNFGNSVSLEGNRLAIGAPQNDGNGSNAGHVRVYDWNGTAWVQLGLDINGEAADDRSGSAVSLEGNRVAIGANNNDGNGTDAGHVRVYDWNGTAWVKLGLDINGEAADDRSGWSVSLDGNRVAIGAIGNDGNGLSAGHVRVYDWNGTAWVQLGLDIDGESSADQSGYSVSLEGNRLAIGANWNDGNGSNAGHVRVYDWNGTAWVQLGADINGEAAADQSGYSVSLVGNRVAIGAPFNDGTGSNAGQVRVYDWNGTAWVQLGLDIDGEAADDYFGLSISLAGNWVAIGAIRNDGNGSNAGHVRVYELPTIAAPEINLQGNATSIVDGDITPSTLDDTNMGKACVGNTRTKTFTIQNTGTLPLNISSILSSQAEFTITNVTLPAVVAASGTLSFEVVFASLAVAVINTTITVNSDDCDEAVYTFAAQGEGVSATGDIVRGSSLAFNGSSNYVEMGNDVVFDMTTAISVEAWVKVNNITGDQKILTKFGDIANDDAYSFQLLNGEPQLLLNFPSGWSILGTGSTLTVGTWYHLAGTYDGARMRIYVNGVEMNSIAQIGSLDVSASTLKLGKWSAGQYLNGSLEELRLWSIARTAAEIRENMHLSLGGCETGLTAYYQMNEGAGTSLADKSSNGKNGTLMAGTTWAASTVNVGNDVNSTNSESQSILAIPAGASTQTFAAANAQLVFAAHSGVEAITVTYQAFTPNSIVGTSGITIIQNPMWTVNKSSTSITMVANYTFTFPGGTFSSLDASKYKLYWRTMNAAGFWTKIATASAITATTATFDNISLAGQFIVVQESEIGISDVRGSMYTFDGVDDYISTNYQGILGANNRTVEAWIKTSATNSTIVSWGTNNSRERWSVMTNANAGSGPVGAIRLEGSNAVLVGYIVVNDNTWHHIAVSFTNDGTPLFSEALIYVDGILNTTSSNSGASSNPPNTTASGLVEIGRRSPLGDNLFNGSIDEVRIWSTGRTQAQIRENMHLTLKGDEASLVSYYQFNNDDVVGTASGVKDAMAANHGTTQNMLAATYVPSEVAVAGGLSDRVTIAGAGTYNFPNTGVSMNFGATTPNGEVVVSRLETEKPHGWSSITGDVDQEYFVVRNYGSNGTFTALNDMTFNRLSYVSPTEAGLLTPLELYKRASNVYGATWGSNWGSADAATSGSNATISYGAANGVVSFSQIVLVSTGVDLPVELLNFNAKRTSADKVQLDWATASETNNKGFYVERMLEVENVFEAIAFVDGKGTTTATSYYELRDQNSYTGVSYYRLRQVDFDGTTSYSDIRAVSGRTGENTVTAVDVYPNPVKENLTIRFNELAKEVTAATLKIMSVDGKVLYQFNQKITAFQQVHIDVVKTFPSAVYLIEISLNNGERVTQKFVKE